MHCCKKMQPLVVKKELTEQAEILKLLEQGRFEGDSDYVREIVEIDMAVVPAVIRQDNWHGTWRDDVPPEVLKCLDELTGWERLEEAKRFRVRSVGGSGYLDILDNQGATRHKSTVT